VKATEQMLRSFEKGCDNIIEGLIKFDKTIRQTPYLNMRNLFASYNVMDDDVSKMRFLAINIMNRAKSLKEPHRTTLTNKLTETSNNFDKKLGDVLAEIKLKIINTEDERRDETTFSSIR
jgi:hypothetical protein